MENFTFTLARFYVLITFSSRSYSWWWEALTGAAKPLRGWLAFSHYKQNPRSKNSGKKIHGRQKKLLEGRLFIGGGDRVHLLELTFREMTSISMVLPWLGPRLTSAGGKGNLTRFYQAWVLHSSNTFTCQHCSESFLRERRSRSGRAGWSLVIEIVEHRAQGHTKGSSGWSSPYLDESPQPTWQVTLDKDSTCPSCPCLRFL